MSKDPSLYASLIALFVLHKEITLARAIFDAACDYRVAINPVSPVYDLLFIKYKSSFIEFDKNICGGMVSNAQALYHDLAFLVAPMS